MVWPIIQAVLQAASGSRDKRNDNISKIKSADLDNSFNLNAAGGSTSGGNAGGFLGEIMNQVGKKKVGNKPIDGQEGAATYNSSDYQIN